MKKNENCISANALLKLKKEYKDRISKLGYKLVYNRSEGGYQVQQGFTVSDIEYPTHCNKKMLLSRNQLEKLLSYCNY